MNHDPDDAPIHNEVAIFHARNMMRRDACNYSQHLSGYLNIISDCFSQVFISRKNNSSTCSPHSTHPYPHHRSEWYLCHQNLSPLDCINGAKVAREKGITKGTHQKDNRSWDFWLGFQHRIRLSDPYLEELDNIEQVRICNAFMYAVQRGDFS